MNSNKKLQQAFIMADVKSFEKIEPYDGWNYSDKYKERIAGVISGRKNSSFRSFFSVKRVSIAAAVILVLVGAFFLIRLSDKSNKIIETNDMFGYSVCEDSTLEITNYTGSMREIEVPEIIDGMTVTKIKSLSSAENVIAVTLPETVIAIEKNAFDGCRSLKEITIPKSVETIEENAFDGCDKLETVYYSGTRSEWDRIDISEKNEKLVSASIKFSSDSGSQVAVSSTSESRSGSQTTAATENHTTQPALITTATAAKTSHTEKTVTSKTESGIIITVVDDPWNTEVEATEETTATGTEILETRPDPFVQGDFSCTYSVENGTAVILKYTGKAISVEIPSEIRGYPVKQIGSYAFEENSQMESVIIPGSVEYIGYMSFSGCMRLKSVELNEGLLKIENEAFSKCRLLSSITIPESVVMIGNGVFAQCGKMTSFKWNSRLKTIPSNLFAGSGLVSLILSDGITEIGEHSFKDCIYLNNIKLPDSLKKIGVGAFDGCSCLTELSVPQSVSEIGDAAFAHCISLKNVALPDDLSKLGASVFFGCKSLSGFNIPSSVTEIGDGTFSGCEKMEFVYIPKSVKKIAKDAFFMCKRLKTILYRGTEDEWFELAKNNPYTDLFFTDVIYSYKIS